MAKKRIVVSGVNLREGGGLAIIKDFLYYLNKISNNEIELLAFVNSKNHFKNLKNINLISFPNIKNSWFLRIYFEYIYCFFFSLTYRCDLWISMHDITPLVIAKNQVVYCHNPTPFYDSNLKDILIDSKFYIFTKFYSSLYKFNIKKNSLVIVQQQWIKEKFSKWIDSKKIIISYPSIKNELLYINTTNKKKIIENKKVFFYPSLPRLFKNMETICEAFKILKNYNNYECELWLTINGKENKYAKKIFNRYSKVNGINFLGKLSREDTIKKMKDSDLIVFPSLLETYGLPLLEAMKLNKPIFASNLEYSKNTCNDYKRIKYIDPKNSKKWSFELDRFLKGEVIYDHINLNVKPDFYNWEDLSVFLLDRFIFKKIQPQI